MSSNILLNLLKDSKNKMTLTYRLQRSNVLDGRATLMSIIAIHSFIIRLKKSKNNLQNFAMECHIIMRQFAHNR